MQFAPLFFVVLTIWQAEAASTCGKDCDSFCTSACDKANVNDTQPCLRECWKGSCKHDCSAKTVAQIPFMRCILNREIKFDCSTNSSEPGLKTSDAITAAVRFFDDDVLLIASYKFTFGKLPMKPFLEISVPLNEPAHPHPDPVNMTLNVFGPSKDTYERWVKKVGTDPLDKFNFKLFGKDAAPNNIDIAAAEANGCKANSKGSILCKALSNRAELLAVGRRIDEWASESHKCVTLKFDKDPTCLTPSQPVFQAQPSFSAGQDEIAKWFDGQSSS